MLQSLYDWTVHFAQTPDAIWALGIVSFIESSVFPIPPDILLIPMIIAAPEQAWLLATVATATSVAGGFLGYAIGRFAFDTIGRRIIRFYGLEAKFAALEGIYRRWGVWIIIVKGMTPIPYKVVTIASGAFHFDLLKFGLASIVCRAIRFYLLAALLYWFGAPIRDFIEGRLVLATTIFVVFLVGGFVVLRHLVPRHAGNDPA
jgi:membrane protein YqaA with SNARE-associated domain